MTQSQEVEVSAVQEDVLAVLRRCKESGAPFVFADNIKYALYLKNEIRFLTALLETVQSGDVVVEYNEEDPDESLIRQASEEEKKMMREGPATTGGEAGL